MIKVVYTGLSQPHRDVLYPNEYQKNSAGKIILPVNYYSMGYYERLTDISWSSLPWLNKQA